MKTALGLIVFLVVECLAQGPFQPSLGDRRSTSNPFNTNPFSSYEKPTVVKKVTFDIAKVGQPGRVETTALFVKIWEQFRSQHTVTDDGSFEQGGGFDESPENQAFFLHYLASNNYVVEMELNEKCKRCDDKGYKVGLVPGAHSRQMDEVGNVMCDACKGEGGPKGKVEYIVTFSGKLPPMPETPAQQQFRSNLEKAKAGNIPAQVLVGSNFWNGKGTAINLEEGMMWYGKAAMSGDVYAAQKVISLYSDSDLKEFYDLGYAAMLHLLWLPESEIDWKLIRHPNPKLGKIEASILLTEAVSLMKSGSKHNFILGSDVRRSFKNKYRVWQSQAELGNESAAFSIGACHLFGIGTQRDTTKAVEWIEKSAIKGHRGSLHILGCLYDLGIYYEKNKTAAYVMYTLASKVKGVDFGSAIDAKKIQDLIVAPEALKILPDLELMAIAGKLSPGQLQTISNLPPGNVQVREESSYLETPNANRYRPEENTRREPQSNESTNRRTIFGVEIK